MSQPSFATGARLRVANDRAALNVAGHAGAVIQLSGTWAGTVAFEGSVDGDTFFAVNATPVAGTTPVSSSTANGVWAVSVAGLCVISARCSVYTSGSIGAMLRSAPGGGSSGGGSAGGGDASAANQLLEIADLDKLAAQILDYDSGAGTANQVIVGIALPASGGPVGVSATNPLPTSGGTFTPSAPAAASVGVASAQAVAANTSRRGVMLVNTSANVISLGLAATAVLYSGITLAPYGSFGPLPNFTGAINAIASGASSNLAIQEFS